MAKLWFLSPPDHKIDWQETQKRGKKIDFMIVS